MDTEFHFRLSDLSQRTEEQAEQIQAVLEQLNPIECELIGDKTVRAISKGATFDSVEGGRHMSFLETISLLSGIATVIQLAIMVIAGLRGKSQKNQKTDAELQGEAQQLITEKISSHPELSNLSNLIAKDPAILDRVVTLLLVENRTQKPD